MADVLYCVVLYMEYKACMAHTYYIVPQHRYREAERRMTFQRHVLERARHGADEPARMCTSSNSSCKSCQTARGSTNSPIAPRLESTSGPGGWDELDMEPQARAPHGPRRGSRSSSPADMPSPDHPRVESRASSDQIYQNIGSSIFGI